MLDTKFGGKALWSVSVEAYRPKEEFVFCSVQDNLVNTSDSQELLFDWPSKNRNVWDYLCFCIIAELRNLPNRDSVDGIEWSAASTKKAKIRRIYDPVIARFACCDCNCSGNVVGVAAS